MTERGELCRILYMEGKAMEKVYDKCCGIDVHKKLIVACLLSGRKSEIREFGATTDELLELSDWLVAAGCEIVAMESFGTSAPAGKLFPYFGFTAENVAEKALASIEKTK